MIDPVGGDLLRVLAGTSKLRGISISVEGRSIGITCEPTAGGLALRCAVQWKSTPPVAAGRALEEAALSEPGDTTMRWADGQLIVERTILDIESPRLFEALYATGKAAMRAERLFQVIVGPPVLPRPMLSLDLTRVEAALREVVASMPPVMVTISQPAWTEPESSGGEPVAHLEPGTVYTLVSQDGDWAEVLLMDGRKVFTDARTLRQA